MRFPTSSTRILGYIVIHFFISVGANWGYAADALSPAVDATQTYSPHIADIPDLRMKADGAGSMSQLLDLDDYVLDADDRNEVTGTQIPLAWSKNQTMGADLLSVGAANELEMTIGAQLTPESGSVILETADKDQNSAVSEPVAVHTTNFLLSAPTVDEGLLVGDNIFTLFPYSWSLDGGQSFAINNVSFGTQGSHSVALVEGISQTQFVSGSMILHAESHENAIAPYGGALKIRGFANGDLTDEIGISARGLTLEARNTGITFRANSAFKDSFNLAVSQEDDEGNFDCYSIAVGGVLEGSLSNLGGSPGGDATIVDASRVYRFENLTLNDLLDAPDADAYEANPDFDDQSTSWIVAAVGQSGPQLPPGGSLGELSIELEVNVPSSTFPGATSGNAFCVELDEPDFCGVIMHHTGIAPDQYEPGDSLTLSMNIYVDLNYGGGLSDDEVNCASNSPTIAMGLGTQPSLEAVNFNYINFPFTESSAESLSNRGSFPGDAGAGGSQSTNIVAGIHGRWSRHEVSLRVPESGVAVQGPAGVGNIAYPNGITAIILLSRIDTAMQNHPQRIYLDNISITKNPGSLVLAHGATKVPMISAGYGLRYEDGLMTLTNGTSPIPDSISRGEEIHGSFSDGSASNNVGSILGDPANKPYSKVQENADAGWLEYLFNTDLAFIAEGGTEVALDFPTLASGNKALVLAPDPDKIIPNYPSPSTSIGRTHLGLVQIGTPYLDMRLMADAVFPGLHVDDVTFAGGSGGQDNQNRIEQNVSGVFGIRFFHRTNAATQSQNSAIYATLTNADETCGLVASRQPNVLTSSDNTTYSGTVWIDDMISGSVISFNSNQRYYDLVLNSQGNGRFPSGGNPALASQLLAQNPGAQLGVVQVGRVPGITFLVHQSLSQPGFNAYQGVYGTSPSNFDLLPGNYSTATVFIDEIGFHAVRDIDAFYDADLCLSQ